MTQDEKMKVWFEALRSGEYKQVQGTLCGELPDGDVGYCCLGVYNKLFEVGEMKAEGYNTGPYENTYHHEGPKDTYNNLRVEIGEELVEEGIDMNDAGKSFVRIAHELEAMYDSQIGPTCARQARIRRIRRR
jgi:hypothetical protein